MLAHEAMNGLDPVRWSSVSAAERLALIKQVQKNLLRHAEVLGEADARMKCDLAGADAVSLAEGIGSTVNAMGNTLMGIRRLYESLVQGEMPQPLGIERIGPDNFAIEVYPVHQKDKLTAGQLKGFIHVKGQPLQISPLDKPAGIIAVSGAGNYSSSIEMAMALFLENKAVIHKPHHLNEATDEIWAKIFAPLIECKALAFIDADQGRDMSAPKRVAFGLFHRVHRRCTRHSRCRKCAARF